MYASCSDIKQSIPCIVRTLFQCPLRLPVAKVSPFDAVDHTSQGGSNRMKPLKHEYCKQAIQVKGLPVIFAGGKLQRIPALK